MPAKGQCKYTPDELEAKVEEYFEYCKENKVEAIVGKTVVMVSTPPDIVGLSLFLGISRETLYRYLHGDYRGDTGDSRENTQQRVCDILTRARDRIIQDAYQGASLGRYNERITQLRLGRMGESVKTEIEHSGNMAVTWQGSTAQEAEDWAK